MLGNGLRFFVLELELDDEVVTVVDEVASEAAELLRITPPKSALPQADAFATFASLLQTVNSSVDMQYIRQLYDRYCHLPAEESVLRAANDLLDIAMLAPAPSESKQTQPSAKRQKRKPHTTPRKQLTLSFPGQRSLLAPSPVADSVAPCALPTTRWTRYIGSLQFKAWATRPMYQPLTYGSHLCVQRLKPTVKSLKGFGAKQQDTTTRLVDTETEREVARLPHDVAHLLAPLLDMHLIHTLCVVLLCDQRLHIGDSFAVHLDISITSVAFEELGVGVPVNAQRLVKLSDFKWHSSVETEGEGALRVRQACIARLFQRLGIVVELLSESEMGCNGTNVIEDKDQHLSQPPADPNQVSLGQLKEFYRTLQQMAMLESLPETSPPSNAFKLSLRPYQRQGLTWMLSREKEHATVAQLAQCDAVPPVTESSVDAEARMNPLWREVQWPAYTPFNPDLPEDEGEAHRALVFYANMYSGELALTKPVVSDIVRGGILADEMGLGKTISTLSLVHAAPRDLLGSMSDDYAAGTTLIVVPMLLLLQWALEFTRAHGGSSRCHVYYGSEGNMNNMQRMLCGSSAPLVVLTTYGTVMSEWQRQQLGPAAGLFLVKFFRIVLDEGHTIRNRTTKTSRLVYDLRSARKWVITGTPMVNRLDDLYLLVKFLELEPWSGFLYWKLFIATPFEQRRIRQALDVVQAILEPVILRRTKRMKLRDGQPLVELPDKEVEVEEVAFDEGERTLYEWFLKRAELLFAEMLANGELMKKYTTILVHILRLRQLCCHPRLVGALGSGGDELDEDGTLTQLPFEEAEDGSRPPVDASPPPATDEEVMSVKSKMLGASLAGLECSICTTSPIEPSQACVASCGHVFCLECMLEHIEFQTARQNLPKCPMCRAEVSRRLLYRIQGGVLVDTPAGEWLLVRYDPSMKLAKIKALLRHLHALRQQSSREKVVVFSQFSAYLDLIEQVLTDEGAGVFKVLKFDGRLLMQERLRVLQEFQHEEDLDGSRYSQDQSQSLDRGQIQDQDPRHDHRQDRSQSQDQSQSQTPTPPTSILLLSLKAGGVGLNLTNASRGFMMDPWWLGSIEDQAIDRLHRIGQRQSVKIVRFVVSGTIEGKMLKIQERKRQLGDLVGAHEEERRQRRLEEIQLLFDSEP